MMVSETKPAKNSRLLGVLATRRQNPSLRPTITAIVGTEPCESSYGPTPMDVRAAA